MDLRRGEQMLRLRTANEEIYVEAELHIDARYTGRWDVEVTLKRVD